MKVLVCGGRDFKDHKLFVTTMLPYLKQDNLVIISGGARGADTCAKSFANKHGIVFEEEREKAFKFGVY